MPDLDHESGLYASHDDAALDPDDLAEWQAQFNRVNAAKSTTDAPGARAADHELMGDGNEPDNRPSIATTLWEWLHPGQVAAEAAVLQGVMRRQRHRR